MAWTSDNQDAECAAPGLFRRIVAGAQDGIAVQDMSGRIEWVNPACERLYGWTIDQMRGHKPQDFILPPETRPPAASIAAFRYDSGRSIFGRYLLSRNIRRDGSVFWNQQSFAMLDLGAAGQKVVVTCRDVTDQVSTELALRQVQVDLRHAAHHDDLTGLANRKKLAEHLGSVPVRAAMARGALGVLVIDIDKFKEINDSLGHGAGDRTLEHVALVLARVAGPRDLACRTGGDEFLLVSDVPDREEGIQAQADAVLRALEPPLVWREQSIRIGASIGACLASGPAVTGEEMIQHADAALYAAKVGGRGRVVLYTDDMGRDQRERQELARDLREAVARDQFEIHLQPQLCLASGRIQGCEALLRWRHPRRGILAPATFLETADGLGLLAEIDYLSMTMALDALQALVEAGFGQLVMSINVSAAILADVNYPGLLDWALQSRGLRPEQICIEVLETTILDGSGADVMGVVARFKRLGVRVALDDFGTGYAGLAHMASFEVDAIKLDRSMIARLDHDPRNRVIVRAIIRLCRLLEMDVVAEGVETPEQLGILRRANCPVIQGFGLARPMPLEALLGWLAANDPLPDTAPFGAALTAPRSGPARLIGHVR
ncbi:putative bifunctional diguanylate cyclase/phosphodiesterase [Roseovarius autotrophicus]|uniref:putative bifunctional diguanylate cyclase/phosphodiesterase n=1 Tax=Roseovarius autotrophicus TaxID=2824121 RepID=UPI001B38A3F2